MSTVALVVASLLCVGHGNIQGGSPLQSLARLFLAPDVPATGWQTIGPGRNLVEKSFAARFRSRCSSSLPRLCSVVPLAEEEDSREEDEELVGEDSTASQLDGLAVSDSDSATFADRYSDRLPAWLINRAAELGYTVPTPVQADTIDSVLDGRDTIVQAKTGSGKTLAYMLPLLAKMEARSSVQALVLLPTRELASQVALVARELANGSPQRLMVMSLLDGLSDVRERKWLVAEPPQLIVGNVPLIDEVLKTGLLKLGKLKLLVVDEMDACLEDERTSAVLQRMLGGLLSLPWAQIRDEALDKDYYAAGERMRAAVDSRQTLFVSATFAQKNHFRKQAVQQRWCREEPVLIHSEPEQLLPSQLRHGWARCSPSKRLAALRVLLRRHDPSLTGAIVFLKSEKEMDDWATMLAGVIDDEEPAVLYEDQSIIERKSGLRALRAGSSRLLLATYIGARGLDIPHCSHVYINGVPETAEVYTHASGRCGRMGRPGLITVLAAEKEGFALKRIGNALGITFHDARKSDGDVEDADPLSDLDAEDSDQPELRHGDAEDSGDAEDTELLEPS